MIPMIMDERKPLRSLVTDKTCIGRLPEAISCRCKEVLWGENVATIVIPRTAKHFDDLHEGGIIKLKKDDQLGLQLYRIAKIGRVLSNGNVTISCEHISYDQKKIPVLPFKGVGVQNAVSEMQLHVMGSYPFKLYTDMTNNYSQIQYLVPTNYRDILGGTEGSFRDIFSGPGGICEMLCDNCDTYILNHRGQNTGVTIEYGKNLSELSHERDVSGNYDALLGYATTQDSKVVIGDLCVLTSSSEQKVLIVDLTDKLAEGQTPTKNVVNTLTQAYAAQNDIANPAVTIGVQFQPLRGTDQYELIKKLETINLGDYVNVRVTSLGVDTLAEVIEVEYDTLEENYVSMVLGNHIRSLSATISRNATKTDVTNSIASYNRTINQEEVFNRLTNNGAEEGLFFEDGHLYINLTYAKAGTIVADMIKGGTLKLGGTDNQNGILYVYNSGGTLIGRITNNGLGVDDASGYRRVVVANGQMQFYLKSGSSWVTSGYVTGQTVNGDVELCSNRNGSVYIQNMKANLTANSQAILTTAGLAVTGTFSATKTKSRLVTTEDYGKRLLYAYEMPSPMFGDIGEGETDENGECIIDIDDVFDETVSTWVEYQVFLQPEGEGNLYIAEKKRNYFIVKGTKNTKFAWELKVKQRDYEYERLDENDVLEYDIDDTDTSIYDDELIDLIVELEEAVYETVE